MNRKAPAELGERFDTTLAGNNAFLRGIDGDFMERYRKLKFLQYKVTLRGG